MEDLNGSQAVPVWLSEDDLGCVICQELLKCPTTLPCGHSFCRGCLKESWKAAAEPGAAGRPGSCPTCREGCTARRELRKNTLLQELVDKYRRAVREVDARPAAAPRPDAPRAPPQPQPQPQPVAQESNSTVHVALTLLLVEQLIDITRSLHRKTQRLQRGPEDELTLEDSFKTFEKEVQYVLDQLEGIQEKLRENSKCKETLEEQPVGERLATLSSSSCPLPEQKSSAPRRASRFAQYAICPTFDRKTLSYYLQMSRDGRTVTVSKYRQRYPSCPERFRVSQVFCSEAFTSGQHYWEVDTVRGNYWSVGVAYGDMNRSDLLGQSLDSWCIEWKRTNQLSGWCSLKETDLGSSRPRVVGILLDLEECKLAFYSVADQEKLLFACPVVRTHPLYPAFWLYGLDPGNSLTIRPVQM